MFVKHLTLRCDVCNKEEEHDSESDSHWSDATPPMNWFHFAKTLVCPDCQEKTTIKELRELNKKLAAKAKKLREAEDIEEED